MDKHIDIASEDIRFRNSADGLFDLGIAAALIVAGIAFLTDMVAVASGFYFPIFLIIVGLKRKVVHPRIGYVQHKGMNIKTRKLLVLFLIMGVVMMVAATFAYLSVASGSQSDMMRSLIQNYGGIVLGAVISLIVILIAKVFIIKRFYLYSLLLFSAFIAMNLIEYRHIIPVALISCGVIIFAAGIVIFLRFIKKYPKLSEDEDEH